ncbi:hypothetical protein Hanom_Chr15g01351351 [Helianthus anomalus]
MKINPNIMKQVIKMPLLINVERLIVNPSTKSNRVEVPSPNHPSLIHQTSRSPNPI